MVMALTRKVIVLMANIATEVELNLTAVKVALP